MRLLPVLALAAVCASLASAASAPAGHIVFASGSGSSGTTRAWVANVNGSGVRAVTPAGFNVTSVAVSHDGRRVAYSRGGEIYVASLDGTQVRRLTTSRATDGAPAWSGDDRWLAWSSYKNRHSSILKMRSSDGGAKTVIAPGGSLDVPAWSPDSRQLAYAGISGQIWVMNADGSRKHALTHTKPGAGVDWAPSWSPDGRRIAYESSVGTGTRPQTTEIWLIGADGRHAVRLTHNFLNDNHPTWSPDGTWLAFASPNPRLGAAHVWLMRPNGSGLHRLTTWAGEQIQPSWGR